MEDFIIILVIVVIGFVFVGCKALREIRKNEKSKKKQFYSM